MKFSHILSITFVFFTIPLYAEITLDGTLGPSVDLTGPDYQIGVDLGQQHGGNLFHSFQDFNLQSFESATFSGPNHIQNVISRVTGGNPSTIDGLIRSTIPNADFYFLNPYGIMFGPNAQLDVQGGFHASTADYLRLEDGGRFDARNPNASILTVAPIEAFGFITNSPQSLSIEGSELSLFPDQTLSFTSGFLNIQNAQLSTPHGRINLASVAGLGEIIPQYEDLVVSAPLGDITIQNSGIDASGEGGGDIYIRGGQFVASNSSIKAKTLENIDSGMINIQSQDILLTEGTIITTTTFDEGQGGNIVIKAIDTVTITGENDQAASGLEISTEGEENGGDAGTLVIEAKNISLTEGGYILSSSWGMGKGGHVILKATESVTFSGEDSYGGVSAVYIDTNSQDEGAGDAGNLLIETNSISFNDGASILANTFGKGNGGTVTFRAKQISLTGFDSSGAGSHIEVAVSEYSNGGHAGHIVIETQDLLLTDGAQVFTPTFGPGNAGDVTISATGTITIAGAGLDGWDSGIASVSNPKFIEDEDGSLIPTTGGLGGNIAIEAQKLVLKDGGQIAASSIAPEGLQSSHAGNISIKVDAIEITGVNPYGENEDGFGSGIYARSKGVDNNTGNAGEIVIETNSLTITDGGIISSGTNNQAQGGNVEIRVNAALRISGDSSNITLNEPAEAQVEYQAGFDDYTQNHSISGISANSSSKTEGAGEAGHIHIDANIINLANGGMINTSTKNAGGGDIVLHVFNRLYLRKGKVTTSVQGGTGDGGNIEIDNDHDIIVPKFVILDNGKIIAQADEGHGGNIRIVAEQFIKTPESLVSASSRLGLDGNVEIDSPDENVNEGVFDLSSSLLDVSRMLDKPCEAMSYEEYQNRTRLVVVPLAGSSPSPFDLQPSRLSFAQNPTQTAFTNSQTTRQKMTNHLPRQVALLTGCQPSQFQTETQAVKENIMPAQLF